MSLLVLPRCEASLVTVIHSQSHVWWLFWGLMVRESVRLRSEQGSIFSLLVWLLAGLVWVKMDNERQICRRDEGRNHLITIGFYGLLAVLLTLLACLVFWRRALFISFRQYHQPRAAISNKLLNKWSKKSVLFSGVFLFYEAVTQWVSL